MKTFKLTILISSFILLKSWSSFCQNNINDNSIDLKKGFKKQHELSIEYGLVSTNLVYSLFQNMFTNNTQESLNANFTLGYKKRVHKKLRFGFDLCYESFRYKTYMQNNIISISDSIIVTYVESFLTIAPRLDWYYMNKEKIRWYGSVAAGLAIYNSEHLYEYGTIFSFLFTPVGVEVGRNYSAFSEFSIGYSGLLSFGFRMKI